MTLRTLGRARTWALVRLVLALGCAPLLQAVAAEPTTPPAGSAPALSPLQTYEAQAAAFQQTLSNQLQEIAQAEQAKAAAESRANVVWVLAAVALGVLAIRWAAPRIGDFLNRRYDPWAPAHSPEQALNEEEAFSRFAEDFTLNPRKAGAAASPGRSEPAASPRASEPVRAEDLVQSFLRNAPESLAEMRAAFASIRAAEPAARQKLLGQFQGQVLAFKAKAHFPPLLAFWQIAGALEGLLAQLVARPAEATPSVFRTMAAGLDLLQALGARSLQPDLVTRPSVRVLAVDDDPICRHALSFSLGKVLGPPDLASDGVAALALAEKVAYDLIFLDVEMPGMDGFELCSRLGATELNRATPVVFVTRHSDFESRTKSCLRGGRDLLGKPFLTFELALKALTMVMHRRLQREAVVPAKSGAAEGGKPQLEPESGTESVEALVAQSVGK